MTLDSQYEAAFAEYEASLYSLEKAFNFAGLPVKFYCFVDPLNNKMVDITRKNKRIKLVCIEGASPAQAVKDVAAGVRL
ncbi:MAG: hypothetical protein LBU82_08235 [Treponema sp.]|jgi:hypothetical protein|nr:hypothetical protein [Treponema sp.]